MEIISKSYLSLFDMDKLKRGQHYSQLGESFIIFICPFDRFNKGRHIYTFRERCDQDPNLKLNDGTTKIFLWDVIAPLFVHMRKRKWDKRELANAVMYLVKTGCQWRNLPHDFPPVFTVHSFYRRARLSGLWDKILQHLVKLTRQRAGLSESPTQALIDSQSVKKGFDAGKKRKE